MPTDPLRAELLRLREIVDDEDVESIDRALAEADEPAVLSTPPPGADPVAAFDRLMELCADLAEAPSPVFAPADAARELHYRISPESVRRLVERRLAEVRSSWTYCADALPAEAGRFEVAALSEDGRHILGDALFCIDGGSGERFWAVVSRHGTVYAWRPVAADPPPLRPADRAYLRAQGVPEEWMGNPGPPSGGSGTLRKR